MNSHSDIAGKQVPAKLGIVNWRLIALHSVSNFLALGTINILALLSIAISLGSAIGLSLITTSSKQVAMKAYESLALNIVTFELSIDNPLDTAQDKPESAAKQDRKSPVETRNRGQWFEFFEKMVDETTKPFSRPVNSWPLIKASCETNTQNGSVNVDIIGTKPGLLKALGYKISDGRDLHKLDNQKLWVVISRNFAKQVLETPLHQVVGKSFLLCGRTYYVAGIATGNENIAEQSVGVSNIAVYASLAALQAQGVLIKEIAFAVDTKNNESAIKFYDLTTSYLFRNSASNVRIRSSLSFAEIEKIQNDGYSRLILLVGVISMVVGAINIANVMSIAVILRKYNIAICMAFGANTSTIALEFLIESAILGCAGAILSVLLAYLVVLPILVYLGMPLIFDGVAIGFTVLTGLVAGVLGGIYPAIRIAKIDPAVILAS